MGHFLFGSFCGLIILYIIRTTKNINTKRKQQAELHRIEMLEERNYQLFYFQLRLIKQFGGVVINSMPDYKEILHSDKPLEAKEWVNIDKLVNLN